MSAHDELTTKLKAEIEKHEKFKSAVVATLTGIVGILSGAGGVYFYLLKQVDDRIAKRLAPYNLMITGLGLNQTQDHDKAAEAFRDALKLDGAKSLPMATQDVIYDGLIYAIESSNDPGQYALQFKAVKKRYDTEVAMDGWRNAEVGWYLLRTGHKDGARPFFDEAKRWYADPEHLDPRAGVSPVQGLLHIALIESDFTEAQALVDDLAIRDPKNFERSDMIRQLRGWPKERWYPSFASKYAGLEANVGQFIGILEASEKKHPSIP